MNFRYFVFREIKPILREKRKSGYNLGPLVDLSKPCQSRQTLKKGQGIFQLQRFPMLSITCPRLSPLFHTVSGQAPAQDVAGIMRRALLLLLIAPCFQLAGCNALQKKHDSPVMVGAPRRVDPADPDEAESKYADSGDAIDESTKHEGGKIEQVGSTGAPKEDDGSDPKKIRAALTKNPWDDWKDDTTIFNSQVAATVNGAPILNGDVLDRYAGYLISIREAMQKAASDPKNRGQIPTPADYERFRTDAIQKEIPGYIHKKVLVERLKSGLKAEQVKAMEGHLDELFQKEVTKLKQDLKVSTKTELELALNKKGTTLQNVKDNFALERLAGECIALKSEKPKPIQRPDLVAYYQSHEDLFQVNAKVKWQQIQVSVNPSLNKKAAIKKLEQAIAELDKNVPFETVARKYSDGPTAKEGGLWDWMEADNLADTKLEKKLFTMPTNELSEIHESPESVCVVRVTDRQEAGRKPFKEVQDEIRSIIEAEQNQNRSKKFIRDLFNSAVIETQYELPKFILPEE